MFFLLLLLVKISIGNIDCRYIDTFEKYRYRYRYRYGEVENIDIDIDIDRAILKNIDIDIDIDKAIPKISISISIWWFWKISISISISIRRSWKYRYLKRILTIPLYTFMDIAVNCIEWHSMKFIQKVLKKAFFCPCKAHFITPSPCTPVKNVFFIPSPC